MSAIDIVKVRNAQNELILLQEYDEDSILQYLATCKERRMLEDAEPYSADDVDVMLVVFTGDSLKTILLGELHYTFHDMKSIKHEILNADEVRENVLELLQHETSI